jgi:hypothetical protein
MAVGLYFDVHVDHAIAGQLRLRQVDVWINGWAGSGGFQAENSGLSSHAKQRTMAWE